MDEFPIPGESHDLPARTADDLTLGVHQFALDTIHAVLTGPIVGASIPGAKIVGTLQDVEFIDCDCRSSRIAGTCSLHDSCRVDDFTEIELP